MWLGDNEIAARRAKHLRNIHTKVCGAVIETDHWPTPVPRMTTERLLPPHPLPRLAGLGQMGIRVFDSVSLAGYVVLYGFSQLIEW
jgi:hypothetical protein